MALTKEQRESVKILTSIRKNINKKNKICMVDGCEATAINSHILQRHGILDNIIENGHMIELRPNDMFKWNADDAPVDFRSVGLNEAISHPLFCNHHDTELFIDIEKGIPDLNNYRNMLLFSYRAICADEYKKRFEAEFINRQIQSQILNFDNNHLSAVRQAFLEGARDLEQMRNLILDEIKGSNDRFEIVHLEYPFFPIYASWPFNFETNPNKLESPEMWDGGIVHIIPLNGKLHIIFVYLKECLNEDMGKYIDNWKAADKTTFGKLLTDLFSQRIENFVMSPSLYRSLNIRNIKNFFKFLLSSYEVYDMNRYADFNIFEGEIWDSYQM